MDLIKDYEVCYVFRIQKRIIIKGEDKVVIIKFDVVKWGKIKIWENV